MNIEVKIFIYVYLLLFIILFTLNFIQILKFKWYIDYYTVIDNMCNKQNLTKYEIESMRYNLYSFLYNIHSKDFNLILNNYHTTYYSFISFFWFFIIILLIFMIFYTGKLMTWLIYIFILIICIVYTTVNGILNTQFNEIDTILSNDENYLNRYRNIYKILSAMIMFSDIINSPVEYNVDKLNENTITLDKLIENNIGSYENLSSISEIRNIKLKVYQNLDFLKYLILEPSSPYFLKYFKNIYIRLSDTSSYQFEMNENIYLSDIFDKTMNIEIINLNLNYIKKTMSNTTNQYFDRIIYYINDALLITYDDKDYYNKISNIFKEIDKYISDNNNKIEFKKYNANLFDDLQNKINIINEELTDNQYKKIYDDINHNIDVELEKLKNINKNYIITLPKKYGKNYIQYFLDNKDLLFDVYENKTDSYYELLKIVNYIGNFIYAYFIYYVIIFFIISHYIYININNIQYSFIMITILTIYIFILFIYSNYSFILSNK